MNPEMKKGLKEYYKELFHENGPTPAAVQHTSRKSQFKRFDILTSIDNQINSIVDVGCGLGDMVDYLGENNFEGKYLGVDFVDEFIDYANRKFSANPNINFINLNFSEDAIPDGYDYVLLSGVFNNKFEGNEEFMKGLIKKMYESCKKGVAFNAMSTYVDYQDEHLYYSDPLKVFDYCKTHLTPKVTLRHDFIVKANSIPFEYCIYLYK